MNLSILIPSKDEPKIQKMVEATENEFPNASQIIVCNDREGRGKGWAVRQALEHATGDVICFIDGDLDIHPRMISRLIPFLNDYDIVVGRKQIRGFISRRWITRASRLFFKILFGLSIDSQTGIKLFKRDALCEWETDDFMFDVEILTKAKDAGFKIIEVPVEVTPYGSTSKRIKSKNLVNCLCSAMKIWVAKI